jgi:hypothetical protein
MTIKDPTLNPFYISKDSYCYTVFETVIPQEKYLTEGSKGSPYEKAHAHYSSLEGAINYIIKTKTEHGGKIFESLKEYINELNKNKNEILNVYQTI